MTLLTHDSADGAWSNLVASAAADHGHLHSLQWHIEQNPKFSEDSLEDTIYYAVVAGRLHILQWLQQQPSLQV